MVQDAEDVEDAWQWRFLPAIGTIAHYGMWLAGTVMPWRYYLHPEQGALLLCTHTYYM
jgi:hypothetical protein